MAYEVLIVLASLAVLGAAGVLFLLWLSNR